MLGRYPHSRSAWSRDEEGAAAARRWLAELDLAERAAQDYRTLSGESASGRASRRPCCRTRRSCCSMSRCSTWTCATRRRRCEPSPDARPAGKTVLAALHEPGHAARHCGFAVLLYDAGRARLGHASEMLTQANLEALYQCSLEAAGTRSFLPLDSRNSFGASSGSAPAPGREPSRRSSTESAARRSRRARARSARCCTATATRRMSWRRGARPVAGPAPKDFDVATDAYPEDVHRSSGARA